MPRTYAYWANCNANLGRDTLRVFLGTSRGPCWWEIDKMLAHEVTPRGPIFPAGHALAGSTAEGWYWDARDFDVLYCSDDKHLFPLRLPVTGSWTRSLTSRRSRGSETCPPAMAYGRAAHPLRDGEAHRGRGGVAQSIGTIIYDENQLPTLAVVSEARRVG